MADLWKKYIVLGLALVSVLTMAFVAQPAGAWSRYTAASASTTIPPTPTPTPLAVELQVRELERRFDSLESLVEVQTNMYDATVRRMESNLNLLLAILAIASLAAGILGLGIARSWIKFLVEKRLRKITSQEITRLVQEEVSQLREEWEPKFTELYEEYGRLTRR